MRLTLWTLVLCLLSPAVADAEIVLLYWSGTKVPLETRHQVELIAKDVAEQYAVSNEYTAEMGPLDFLHGGANVKIHIWNEDKDEPAYYFLGEIFMHVSLTLDLQDFRQKLMHEFSHLYDYTCVEQRRALRAKTNPLLDFKMRKKLVKDPLTDYVKDNEANEARARRRETAYMAGPGMLRLHGGPDPAVKSFDFRKGARKPSGIDGSLGHFLDSTGTFGGMVIGDRAEIIY